MKTFLLQSTVSLGVLLAVYYALLQREKMHVFNRFYLLFAICFSFILPFIQITVVQEVFVFPESEQKPGTIVTTATEKIPVASINYIQWSLYAIYTIGAFVMLFRFIKNLWHLRTAIIKNEVLPYANARLVLLDQPILPHSFLHYIFVNRAAYQQNNIEEALFRHELTHVRQRHTLDIFFIELVKIISWFNPLIHLYRKAIKLNHEFLADQSVLKTNDNVVSYQEILLNKIFMNKASGLASHVHYSLTKKRLIMMSKNTSFLRALSLKIAVLPVCTVLVLLLCIKTVAQVHPLPEKQQAAAKNDTLSPPLLKRVNHFPNIKNQDSLKKVKDRYYSNRPEIVWKYKTKDGPMISKKYSEMTPAEKEMLLPPPDVPELNVPTQAQLDKWLDSKVYGVWLNSKRISNEELRQYKPADFGEYDVSKLSKNAINYGKHYYQVNLTTRQVFDAYRAMYKQQLGIK